MIGVVLYGQLGNQMFQYAAAQYLAKMLDTSVLSVGPRSSWRGTLLRMISHERASNYPDAGRHNGVLHASLGHGGSELDLRVRGKLRTLIDAAMFDRIYEPRAEVSDSGAVAEHFDSEFFSLKDRTLLSGWLQSSAYWRADRKFVQDLYAPAKAVLELREDWEKDNNVRFDDAIALHIRRGDYLDMRHGLSDVATGWTLPGTYYREALDKFPDDQPVLVFSDDPEWARQNFTGSRFFVQPMRAAETDLFLLSMCKDKIIANSSFSWWAAYLGEHAGGLTIAPKHHLGWKIGKWVPNDISEPDWTYLNVDKETQPEPIEGSRDFAKGDDALVVEKLSASEAARTLPPVSVLIPCYNAERWVGQAIESALSQSATVEVIVYNDGSTDNSLEVIKGFGDKIRVLDETNKGAPTARSALLAHASHDWIQYLDADDYLLPEKIRQQLEYVTVHPDVDVFYGPVWIEWRDQNWDQIGGELDRSPIPEPHDPWHLLALWRLPQTGGPIWRKSAIQDVGGWKLDQPCCQEHELYLRFLKHGKTFFHTPEGGAVYRRFDTGTVSTQNMGLVRLERTKIEQEIERHLVEQNALTPARKWAINQARFEMARNAWAADKSEARQLQRAISASMPDFVPAGPAAPRSYLRLYKLMGFEFSENVAAMSRRLSRLVGK